MLYFIYAYARIFMFVHVTHAFGLIICRFLLSVLPRQLRLALAFEEVKVVL